MKYFSLLLASTTLLSLAAATTHPAYASNSSNEKRTYHHCKIYSPSFCTGGGADPTSHAITDQQLNEAAMPTWSAQAGQAKATVAIDLYNVCRWVDPSDKNTTGKDLFVPLKTKAEWDAFVAVAPKDIVSLIPCARPGKVSIPPNDPAASPSDSNMKCYDNVGKILTTPISYTTPSYERAGNERTETPAGKSFSCYTLDGAGPLTKTITAVKLIAYDADRKTATSPDHRDGTSTDLNNTDWGVVSVTYNSTPGTCGTAHGQIVPNAPSGSALCSSGIASGVAGTGPWTWTCRGLANTASCQADTPVPGVCGTANGKSLTSAPSGTELCSTGEATTVSGTGTPSWTWSCLGTNDGNDVTCSAEMKPPTCPPVTVYGPRSAVGPRANPLNNGYMDIKVSGVHAGRATALPPSRPSSTSSTGVKWENWKNCNFPGRTLDALVQCVVTDFVKNEVTGYSNMTESCSVSDSGYISPIKVNLAGGDAMLNSNNPTPFYLTLRDGRLLHGYGTGGLNEHEGWLMVRRSAAPLIYKSGTLNGDNWFGDRDQRTINGYTDLAETFSAFIEKDENEQRFIPLHVLTSEQRKTKTALAAQRIGQITDPSFDLRIIDAEHKERFASDYFSRIYVDYRNVVEGDGDKGSYGKNVILERGVVRTINGENHAAIDQWFILDIPGDYTPAKGPTKSKILPANTQRR